MGDPVLFADGRTTLQFYSQDGLSKWPQLGYLTLFIGFYWTAAFLALTFINYSRR